MKTAQEIFNEQYSTPEKNLTEQDVLNAMEEYANQYKSRELAALDELINFIKHELRPKDFIFDSTQILQKAESLRGKVKFYCLEEGCGLDRCQEVCHECKGKKVEITDKEYKDLKKMLYPKDKGNNNKP